MSKRVGQLRSRRGAGSLLPVSLAVAAAGLAAGSGYAQATPLPLVAADGSAAVANDVSPSPAPRITRAPASLTYDTWAHFDFADRGSHGFKCRLDKTPWVPCAPGASYHNLAFGRHCFEVAAQMGRLWSAPASFCWSCRPVPVEGRVSFGGNAPQLFFPGKSEALDVAITNPFGFALQLLSLSVTVGAVPTKDGLPDPSCPASANLLPSRSLDAKVTVPARSTETLSDLGVPRGKWPVLTMPDLPVSQDACEGATFTLIYHGVATPYSGPGPRSVPNSSVAGPRHRPWRARESGCGVLVS